MCTNGAPVLDVLKQTLCGPISLTFCFLLPFFQFFLSVRMAIPMVLIRQARLFLNRLGRDHPVCVVVRQGSDFTKIQSEPFLILSTSVLTFLLAFLVFGIFIINLITLGVGVWATYDCIHGSRSGDPELVPRRWLPWALLQTFFSFSEPVFALFFPSIALGLVKGAVLLWAAFCGGAELFYDVVVGPNLHFIGITQRDSLAPRRTTGGSSFAAAVSKTVKLADSKLTGSKVDAAKSWSMKLHAGAMMLTAERDVFCEVSLQPTAVSNSDSDSDPSSSSSASLSSSSETKREPEGCEGLRYKSQVYVGDAIELDYRMRFTPIRRYESRR